MTAWSSRIFTCWLGWSCFLFSLSWFPLFSEGGNNDFNNDLAKIINNLAKDAQKELKDLVKEKDSNGNNPMILNKGPSVGYLGGTLNDNQNNNNNNNNGGSNNNGKTYGNSGKYLNQIQDVPSPMFLEEATAQIVPLSLDQWKLDTTFSAAPAPFAAPDSEK